MWKDFDDFYTFIDSTKPLQTYVIGTYLAHFLISWVVFKKKEVQGLPLVGPTCEPPNSLEVGTKRSEEVMNLIML
jgi:hypothetical protein